MTIGLLSVGGGAAADEAPATIVERAIAFHGGERYRHSETELTLCSGSGCYELAVRVEGDLYDYRVEGPYRGRTRTVRATNDSVAVWRDGRPLAVLPELTQSLRDWAMARVYFPFLPYRLLDPGVRHEPLGREAWAGRELVKVKVSFEPGSSSDAEDEYLYWFDPETARLEQLAYSFTGNPGGLRFRRLRDYRRVGGLLFADHENLGVEGEGLTVDEVTPAFVAERMRPVSEITLREIRVRPLGEVR